MRIIVWLIYSIVIFSSCYSQKPVEKWSFDGEKSFFSEISNFELKHAHPDFKLSIVKGIKGNGIQSGAENNVIITNIFSRLNLNEDFSLGFYFKGGSFTFTSYPAAKYRIRFGYDNINIVYPKKENKTGQVQIPLNGSRISSYDYLANGDWHHFLFAFKRNGEIQLWIDGQTIPSFKIPLEDFEILPQNISDGIRTEGKLDEIEVFNQLLPNDFIVKRYSKNDESRISTNNSSPNLIESIKSNGLEGSLNYDRLDFAPGYPNYTLQATDQLRLFPSPRFSSTREMPRNFPWLDITYLHRELTDVNQRFGAINPEVAVNLTEEMAKRWNYYIELPILRTDSQSAYKKYTASNEIFSALIKYANANPEIPVASILIQPQGKAVHAGFDYNGAFVTSQTLPDKYYLSDKNGKPIIYQNKKWLSPFTSDEVFINDGKVAAFYINQLSKHLTRKIDIFNENGEWFGHNWKEDLLNKSPHVSAFRKKYDMDNREFNGWMHHHFDSIYKTSILQNIPWKDAKFTFYNVSAYNPSYWPDYKKRINTNSLFNGYPRSTPSFYPARPNNWRIAAGALNGYGTIAEGRKTEIEAGVKLFAPFISAGWGLEEENIRPAQWLALLKSMVMLGADFFHVGYFNVTGMSGWPNGKGPNDPRGYIYQVAMPGYAQAIGSRVYEFLEKGELLNPQAKATSNIYSFRFKASQENHLVLVRKLNNQYLIYGSIQPNSNYVGNVPDEANTKITLEGKALEFKIRRQGSMYIYVPGTNPKFIQLDGWHQKEHPFYWSKTFELEAELADNLNWESNSIWTKNYYDGDFTKAISYVKLNKNNTVNFSPGHSNNYKRLTLRIRTEEKSKIEIKSGTVKSINIGKSGWKNIEIDFPINSYSEFSIKVLSGEVDIDKVILSN